ncbi:MAG: sulfatase [Actinomycetota bacterium]
MTKAIAALAAICTIVAAAVFRGSPPVVAPDRRPNVLLVLTDDQTLDTIGSDPPAMPWFQSQLADPAGHWLWFTRAVASTPLCCPSRSTILTGRYDAQTGVRNNEEGPNLDDTNTLPVWLDDAGYTTGLVGKYLNFYPWGGAPFVPPGWDRWFAKENADESTAYYDYEVVDQGIVRHYGDAPSDYATDVLGAQALRFVQDAPADAPWFLYFSPNAPHLPWVPSPAHAGAFDGVQPPIPDLATMNDVRGKPAYVRDLAPKTQAERQSYIQDDRNERAMLLSVDAWFQQIVDAVAARGELDNTVIVFLGDNGYTLGLHRLDGKRYPYTPSVRVPFAIRTPWAPAATVGQPVSNVDVAGTIAALAGVTPGLEQMGSDLGPAIRGDPLPPRPGVFLDWGGDDYAPAWQGVLTRKGTYVRNVDGFQELYRARDTWQLHNVVDVPGARALARRDRSVLAVLGAEAQG